MMEVTSPEVISMMSQRPHHDVTVAAKGKTEEMANSMID